MAIYNSLIINQLSIIQKYMYNSLIFNKEFSKFFAKSLGISPNSSYLYIYQTINGLNYKLGHN